jgi:histone H3/H4
VEEEEPVSTDLSLPFARMSKLMRTDKDVSKLNRDAVLAMVKCTKLFLEMIAGETATVVIKGGRKVVQYKDFTVGLEQHAKPNTVQFVVDELAFDAPAPGN